MYSRHEYVHVMIIFDERIDSNIQNFNIFFSNYCFFFLLFFFILRYVYVYVCMCMYKGMNNSVFITTQLKEDGIETSPDLMALLIEEKIALMDASETSSATPIPHW